MDQYQTEMLVTMKMYHQKFQVIHLPQCLTGGGAS